MINISFFIKVGAANVLLKLNYLQSRVETQYRKIIFITPSNIKHFIERSSVTWKMQLYSPQSIEIGIVFNDTIPKIATDLRTLENKREESNGN